MAKKIEEVPLPKEGYLHGYKPITPHFADDDEDEKQKTEQPAPPASVAQPSPTPKKKATSGAESDYESLFITPISKEQKIRKICISVRHYNMLNALVERLGTDGNPLTMVGYLWNVLENHFAVYGKTIKGLIDKAPPKNPFDSFE